MHSTECYVKEEKQCQYLSFNLKKPKYIKEDNNKDQTSMKQKAKK